LMALMTVSLYASNLADGAQAPTLNNVDLSIIQKCAEEWGKAEKMFVTSTGYYVDDPCNAAALGRTDGRPWEAPSPCYPANALCTMGCVQWNGTTFVSSLILRRQGLTGSVCKGLTRLRRLQALDISYNRLEGKLPVNMGTNLARTSGNSQLSYLQIGSNNITGPIPESFAYLPLTTFGISPNYWLCGTEWLGALGIPTGTGSKTLEKAIINGYAGMKTQQQNSSRYATSPWSVSYAGTNLGVDCSLVKRGGDDVSFGQLFWSSGCVGVVLILSTWCLRSG